MNYALLHGDAGELEKAAKHVAVAVAVHEKFTENEDILTLLKKLEAQGILPAELKGYL
jgi:hypothetical protein